MKKVLYLLLICTLFASCSSDDDKDETKYLDNKIIEGSWYWIQYTDSTVYTFTDIATRKVYNKYSLKETDSRLRGSYKVTETNILYSNGSRNPYKLNNDSLWIMESADGTYTQYIRVKK